MHCLELISRTSNIGRPPPRPSHLRHGTEGGKLTDGSVPSLVVKCSLFVQVLAHLWSEVRSYLHKKCLDDASSAVINPISFQEADMGIRAHCS